MTEQLVNVTYKFGGFWSTVKKEDRRKYEGGKQKTIKLDRAVLNLDVLTKEVERICPWLQGYCYELHYYILGTSPKEYKLLTTDCDEMEFARQSMETGRAEIIVSLEDESEIVSNKQLLQHRGPAFDVVESRFNESETYDGGQSSSGVIDVGVISVGSRFSDSLSFKLFLRSKAILENFGVKIKSSEKKRVIAVCSHRGWIAHEIKELIKKQPNLTPKQINDSLEMTHGLSLSYMKLWRSRELARELIFGAVEENYRWVPAMRMELLSRNPGSHITYTYDASDNSFRRFFVSFKVCIDGFIVGCRPLVGLDACHLKSKFLGVLLSATSLDGNNGLFNLAFAVVESESKNTWEWFLENLLEAFSCEISPLAFISDMEKGLEQSIRGVFPYAEHRVCMRHLWKNIKKAHHLLDSQRLRNLIWSAANTYSRYTYESKLLELFHLSPVLHSYLLNLPYKWARCEFSVDIKNPYNTNNMAESFNAWITDAREKPVVDFSGYDQRNVNGAKS